jgi:hypothetical protein
MKEERKPTKAYYAKCEVATSLGKIKLVTLCFTPVLLYLLISEGFILGLLLSFQIGALLFGEEDSLPSYFYGDTIGQSCEQNMPSEALLLLPVSFHSVNFVPPSCYQEAMEPLN